MMKGKDQLMRRKPSIAANIAFNLASEEAEAEAAGSHIELGTEGVHLAPTGASIITVLPTPDMCPYMVIITTDDGPRCFRLQTSLEGRNPSRSPVPPRHWGNTTTTECTAWRRGSRPRWLYGWG